MRPFFMDFLYVIINKPVRQADIQKLEKYCFMDLFGIQ